MKKLIIGVTAALAVILLLVIVIKLIGAAAGIITGAFNAILGVAVIIALIAIVIWMFSYAKKSK